jgi:enoyl-CoA hydratase / 3-hydroxyacyl-CoA dehydrogenase
MSEAPQYETLIVEHDGPCAKVTLNRPHRLNTISPEMVGELSKVFAKLEEDKETRCVILTGAGDRAFSAGADVTAFTGITPSTAVEASLRGHEVTSQIERLSKPVIAAINGYAFGGGLELALACDFRIASENAELGQTEINLGLIPGWGGTQRLGRLVGFGRAKELIMTGARLKAEDALRIGLVNRVVPPDKLNEETSSMAKKFAEGPPIALKLAKYMLNFGTQAPLDVALKMESEAFGLILSTKDVMEGVSAFVSKRKPEFKGK